MFDVLEEEGIKDLLKIPFCGEVGYVCSFHLITDILVRLNSQVPRSQ